MKKQVIIRAGDLKPTREDFEIIGVFNPGVIRYRKEIILVARVAERVKQTDPENYLIPRYTDGNGIEIIKIPKNDHAYDFSDPRIIVNHRNNFLTSMSHLRIGRSTDGVRFTFSPDEYLMPQSLYEEYGLEDPRITKIGSSYYLTYSAVSSCGITVGLMKTKDFRRFRRLGNIFHNDNKDCVIFPKKIRGKYYAFHRPSASFFGKLDMWTAESNNLLYWGNHQIMTDARVQYTASERIGAGAVPLLTDRGWLEIYHSADSENTYHLTAMLLDRHNPSKVLAKSVRPILTPVEQFETEGFLKNVVFTCGLLPDYAAGELLIYYGACDDTIVFTKLSLSDIWNTMENI